MGHKALIWNNNDLKMSLEKDIKCLSLLPSWKDKHLQQLWRHLREYFSQKQGQLLKQNRQGYDELIASFLNTANSLYEHLADNHLMGWFLEGICEKGNIIEQQIWYPIWGW